MPNGNGPVAPPASARAAALRHVSDSGPGIRRIRAGQGFRYQGPRGRAIRDRATLARLKSLAVPPAWTGVWISALPHGHVQATGRDARGRKQYRYHPRWARVRDETKYERMAAFGAALPRIRAAVKADLARTGLPLEAFGDDAAFGRWNRAAARRRGRGGLSRDEAALLGYLDRAARAGKRRQR